MSGEYFLGSSEWAAARLRLQHELTKTNFDGHVLDPHIPPLKPGMTVADVACGTGVWLLDVLDTAPRDVGGVGLDVQLNGVPPARWLSENASFQHLNILEPLPSEHESRYDIVHAQFASSFVRDAHIKPFLDALTRMLKPGGHLQLTETQLTRWSWQTADGANDAPELASLHALFSDVLGGFDKQWTWLNDIERALRDAGLEDVGARRPRAKVSTLQPTMMNFLLAQGEMSEALATHPVLSGRAGELKAQRERAAEEARVLGTGLDVALVRCWGRKPV